MTKTQKIALGTGGLLIAAIIGYVIYRRRWKDFDNIGDSQWLPTRHKNGRLALQMPNADHGIVPGTNIEIDHSNPVTPKGNAQVLDVVEKDGLSFVITNLSAPAENPDFSGKYRVI